MEGGEESPPFCFHHGEDGKLRLLWGGVDVRKEIFTENLQNRYTQIFILML